MAYKRRIASTELLRGESLTKAMAGIGMLFAVKPASEVNIEDTLLAVSVEGMEYDDLRVLAVLATWIKIHHTWINVDRLIRAVSNAQSERVRAFWTATAEWQRKDRRFARMRSAYTGPRIDVMRSGTDFQIKRKDEDLRFKGTCLRVPASVLRDRDSDVVQPAELSRIHKTYRFRVLMGPTYRADMWSALESDPSLSVSELARRTYGSFATAWQIKQDYSILAA